MSGASPAAYGLVDFEALNAWVGTVLKGDYLHVSAQYARQLAPDVRHLLSESGVLPD